MPDLAVRQPRQCDEPVEVRRRLRGEAQLHEERRAAAQGLGVRRAEHEGPPAVQQGVEAELLGVVGGGAVAEEERGGGGGGDGDGARGRGAGKRCGGGGCVGGGLRQGY